MSKAKFARENRDRAAYVRGLLEQSTRYSAKTEGHETALVDLLSDIRHFCDSRGLNLADIDRVAHNHYTCEVVQARTGVEQS